MTQTAKIYGESLYELAYEEKLTTEILEQLDMAVQIFRENPKYEELLLLPSVPKKERCAIIDESFGGRVHTYLVNFLKILMENGTIRELHGCAEAFRQRYYADNGIMAVTAVTAVPLKSELQEALEKKLAAVTGKTIKLTMRTDPDVMGGIRIEMDGKRFDGTVRSRLNEVQKALLDTVL